MAVPACRDPGELAENPRPDHDERIADEYEHKPNRRIRQT